MKVLILEDDFDLVQSWRDKFEQAGIETVHVHGATEGLAQIQHDHVDAVIADIFIRDDSGQPLKDRGILLLGKMRTQLPRNAQPKTIAVSGFMPSKYSGIDPLVTVENMGADLVMRKPFRADELVAAVLELLQPRVENR